MVVTVDAVRLHGEDVAGLDRAAVEMDGARAALRGVAADVRAGEPQLIAEKLDEQDVGFDVAVTALPLTVRLMLSAIATVSLGMDQPATRTRTHDHYVLNLPCCRS